MKAYSGYLFDVGATLIKFDEERRAEAYAERAAQVGVKVSVENVLNVLTNLGHEIPERSHHLQLSLLPAVEQRAFWVDFWAEGFRRLGVQNADAIRFAEELLDSVNGGNFQAVFTDTVPTLRGLNAEGKQLGIISNFSSNCESLLGELGIAHYFDFFIVSAIFGVEKPDPRIFQAAIKASGKPVAELVYIGDSILHDIDGAHGVGMDAILVDRFNLHPDFLGTRVTDLRELLIPQVQVK